MARIVDNTNQLAAPRWAGDFGSPELGLMRGGFRLDSAQFESTTYTVTLTADKTAPVTSIAVSALPVAIPSGTFLDFTGTGKLVETSADAAKGATSIATVATDADLSNGDTAPYVVDAATPVTVASGTPVGRTLAERDSGDDFGPADPDDDEIYLIYFEVYDTTINPDFVAYRPYAGRIVKENYLPGFDDYDADLVTALRARYQLIVGME